MCVCVFSEHTVSGENRSFCKDDPVHKSVALAPFHKKICVGMFISKDIQRGLAIKQNKTKPLQVCTPRTVSEAAVYTPINSR